MTFQKESDFEEALIRILTTKGWESTILKYPTEQDLIRNWANILFDNNRGIDRLGDYPLTDSEMQQIVEQIRELRTPLKLNGFINGKTVSVKRDNPDDKAHFGEGSQPENLRPHGDCRRAKPLPDRAAADFSR